MVHLHRLLWASVVLNVLGLFLGIITAAILGAFKDLVSVSLLWFPCGLHQCWATGGACGPPLTPPPLKCSSRGNFLPFCAVQVQVPKQFCLQFRDNNTQKHTRKTEKQLTLVLSLFPPKLYPLLSFGFFRQSPTLKMSASPAPPPHILYNPNQHMLTYAGFCPSGQPLPAYPNYPIPMQVSCISSYLSLSAFTRCLLIKVNTTMTNGRFP